MSEYVIRPPGAATWDAFVNLAQKPMAVWNGCWCTWFHPACAEKGESSEGNRAYKERLVREGKAHAALVFDGDLAVAWCQYGSPDELPSIYHLKEYNAGRAEKAPDYRLTRPSGVFSSDAVDASRKGLRVDCQRYDLGVPVEVQTEVEINRPRAEVAEFASDPDNAVSWYENIESVEWKTPRPLAIGSRIAFVARFLGRLLAYTYEIETLVPGERFVMTTGEGPFPMETTYTWSDTPEGATSMTLRNFGEPSGFGKIAAPVMASAMRRANRQDLARLKEIIESRAA
jgi:Polyketide cyclase / dehydrase and lipid transport